ncbi:MAG: magnesium transporter [Gammaproteobacteria bacterium]|jgi:magnesium transporter
MRKFSRSTHTVGLPPGTLTSKPSDRTDTVGIHLTSYDASSFDERSFERVEDFLDIAQSGRTTWISVDGLHDSAAIKPLGERYDLHPLLLEDALNTAQRPKVERYGDSVYLVVRMLDFDSDLEEIESVQISLVLTKNTLITLVDGEPDVFEIVRERIRSGRPRIRRADAAYLAYALFDIVVDHYFVLLEQLGEHMENIEEALMVDPGPETLGSIHRLKRELIYLRKSVWPLRETIATMMRDEDLPFHDSIQFYLRDLHDHTIQVIETIESYRELTTGMLETHLSLVSNRMNEVMKTLTVIATLFIPLTFVVGVYGMNFDHMPELHWRWAYPALLAFMAGAAIVMLMYFKRKKWF